MSFLVYLVIAIGLVLVGVLIYRKRRRSTQPKVKKEEVKMRTLQVTYSGKEKLEALLKNLKGLQKKHLVTKEQYDILEAEYKENLTKFVGTIEEIKEGLKRKLKAKKVEVKRMNDELDMFEVKNKVGQISLTEFSKLKERLQRRIQRKEEEVSKLETLINSKSSTDLGGYIEVKVGETEGTRPTWSDILPSEFPGFTGLSEILSSRLTLTALICGITIVISTFLPWANMAGLTDAGIANSQGVLCLFMGLFAVVLVFLNSMRIRGMGHLVTGIIAIIGVGNYWANISNKTFGYGSPDAGLIFCLIATIIIIIVGIVEFRRA